jgi:hypothetical protein
MNERPEHAREIKLPKESEFRFELEAGAPIAIRVRFPNLFQSIAIGCNGPDRSGRGGQRRDVRL